MENIDVKPQTIPGGDIVKVINGKTTIKYNISNKYNSLSRSDQLDHIFEIDAKDIIPFLVGLTAVPSGGDGTSDSEVRIFMEVKLSGAGSGWGWKQIKLDRHLHVLQERYVLWTNDGEYADHELQILQARMSDQPTQLTDDDIARVLAGEVRIGMSIDMFDTVFARDAPLAFLLGLRCYESVANTGEVRLIRLDGPDPDISIIPGDDEDDDGQIP